jgi:isopentenyldiphosphate isomerase
MVNHKILEKVKSLNNFKSTDFFEFLIEDTLVGIMHKNVIKHLPKSFQISSNKVHLKSLKKLERIEIIENCLLKWRESNLFECLNGWRNEKYSIYGKDKVLCEIERAGCSLFGVRTLGCHLNAYLVKNNEIMMWIGKRSKKKQTWPGYLDNMVAGGLAVGYTPLEAMIKECQEEAGISPEIAKNIILTGVTSFFEDRGDCYQPSTNYVFDLKVDLDFIPNNIDGEVESFELLTMDEIKSRIDEFKPEAFLVIVDFMIRYGIIGADEPGYMEIQSLLKARPPFPDPIWYG